MYATDLVAAGTIGRVIQVIGLGPHRLGKANRPDWFFEKAKFGGILTDIGSHQFEQFLTYTGATDATVTVERSGAQVATVQRRLAHAEHEAALLLEHHIGGAREPRFAREARRLNRAEPRYRWRGSVPH